MIVGTPSCRRRAPSAIPPWPPPTITTYGWVSWPSSRASRSRASSHVSRSGSAPCSTPCGRPAPRGSSWPLSSWRVVSSVQAWPSRRRRWPRPRPVSVSNSIQASAMPSASVGGSVVRQPRGFVCASVASSMSLTPSRPSTVLMFHVNETRSRQKLSSVNSSAAAALSPSASALSKRESHASTLAATGWAAVSVIASSWQAWGGRPHSARPRRAGGAAVGGDQPGPSSAARSGARQAPAARS